MPACPTCGFTLTYKEWNLGNCTSCSSPLRDLSKTRDPIAAATKTAGDVAIPAAARPGWGTVRSGMALVIFSLVMFWGGLLLTFYARAVWSEATGGAPSESSEIVMWLATIVLRVSVIILPIAVCMTAVTPKHSRCRIWGWLAGGFAVLWIVMWLGTRHMELRNQLAEVGGRASFEYGMSPDEDIENRSSRTAPFSYETITTLMCLTQVIAVVGVPFFAVYLWRLAVFLRCRTLALNLLATSVISAIGCILFIIRIFDKEPASIFQIIVPVQTPELPRLALVAVSFAHFAWLTICLYLLRKRITQLLREEPDPA